MRALLMAEAGGGQIKASFEACRYSLRLKKGSGWMVQIFDNLIGCTNNFVRTLSSTGATIISHYKNESLIPAQNQRWRRA
jgi:hypothetical protein